MHLLLKRRPSKSKSTIGELFADGHFICYTLEDVERDVKVYAQTAIPPGIYQVVISRSPRFKRDLPLLKNVPNYEGVRIHPGNKPEDTEGCILVGTTVVNDDFIGNSRVAFEKLFAMLTSVKSRGGNITLEIQSAHVSRPA